MELFSTTSDIQTYSWGSAFRCLFYGPQQIGPRKTCIECIPIFSSRLGGLRGKKTNR